MLSGHVGYGQTSTPLPLAGADEPNPCPIEFNFHWGQRINLTLLDFALRNRTTPLESSGGGVEQVDHGTKLCNRYAVVEEPTTGNTITICGGARGGGGGERERNIYISRSNIVHLKLTPSVLARFLLKFEGTLDRRHYHLRRHHYLHRRHRRRRHLHIMISIINGGSSSSFSFPSLSLALSSFKAFLKVRTRTFQVKGRTL